MHGRWNHLRDVAGGLLAPQAPLSKFIKVRRRHLQYHLHPCRVLCLPINRKQYGSHGRSIWIRPGAIRPGANRCQQVAGPPSLYAHTAAPAVSVPTYAVTPRHFLVVAKRASALDSYKCHSNLVPASRHIESLICYGERLHQFWRVGLLP